MLQGMSFKKGGYSPGDERNFAMGADSAVNMDW